MSIEIFLFLLGIGSIGRAWNKRCREESRYEEETKEKTMRSEGIEILQSWENGKRQIDFAQMMFR